MTSLWIVEGLFFNLSLSYRHSKKWVILKALKDKKDNKIKLTQEDEIWSQKPLFSLW